MSNSDNINEMGLPKISLDTIAAQIILLQPFSSNVTSDTRVITNRMAKQLPFPLYLQQLLPV